jgi:hypothetical protein
MNQSQLALHVSLISRIAAQYTHELAFGMWNPDFCSSDAKYKAGRFLAEMDDRLQSIRSAVGHKQGSGE